MVAWGCRASCHAHARGPQCRQPVRKSCMCVLSRWVSGATACAIVSTQLISL